MPRNDHTPTRISNTHAGTSNNSIVTVPPTMRQRYTPSTDTHGRENDPEQDTDFVPVTKSYSHSPPSSITIDMQSDLFLDKGCRRKLVVLGVNLTHQSPKFQFIFIATCFFACSLLYGYLQELIAVQLANRQLALFLASIQFLGYSLWSYVLFSHQYQQQVHKNKTVSMDTDCVVSPHKWKKYMFKDSFNGSMLYHSKIPIRIYLYLSVLRAIDLSMTNLAMGYLNYPAKTLMKSSRVAFTMLFAAIFWGKRYQLYDYAIVLLMVLGLGLFLHADSESSVVFNPMGIIMITISLLCDGAVINISERLMNRYDVGQDEFIFRSYSIACLAIFIAAAFEGDLTKGFRFLTVPGTWDEVERTLSHKLHDPSVLDGSIVSTSSTWNVLNKVFVIGLFSTMGFLSSSCSSAITKEFGALTTSITSTARKAITLFLSFALFGNICTMQHVVGIFFFISGLTAKSLRASTHTMEHAKNSHLTLKEIIDPYSSLSGEGICDNVEIV
jgi:adenosine 3'-phospho 5'-phosphosulfate transporter B3